MPEHTLPLRQEIPIRYTWNAESVYPDLAAWEAEYAALTGLAQAFGNYQGRLGTSAAALAEGLAARDDLLRRLTKLVMYARMSYAVDTTNQAAAALQSRAQALLGKALGAIAFLEPEVLAIGRDQVNRWLAQTPQLAIYAHYFDDLFRRQAHLRSAEVEELLGLLVDPFGGAEHTASLLVDADLRFRSARTREGVELTVAQGTIERILNGPDREARRTAWESYQDGLLSFKNTLANTLLTSAKQCTFRMHARRHTSTLAMSLFENHVPEEVYHRLIETFRAHLPTWHRYWRLRRRALGVERLAPYDIWAPLLQSRPTIPYEQAVEWICAGLAPLGEEYVQAVRRGCGEERWVDVYPNQGKVGGAFSSGSYDTYPFILMSYDDTVFGMGTLAHELGHSMHSYLTCHSQPFIYSDYSLFVAEVASNFHQAMVRAYLLNTLQDRALKIAVLEEAMSNLHRYLFIMPTLARFELEMHQRVDRGEGLAADDLIALMADLFAEGYGGEVELDRERVGITWAAFMHLYVDYYVYQYATGISAANALCQRVLHGGPAAREDYLAFLRAGSSLYPLDALRRAGVDMTTSQPVAEAFAVLAGLVDELESLLR